MARVVSIAFNMSILIFAISGGFTSSGGTTHVRLSDSRTIACLRASCSLCCLIRISIFSSSSCIGLYGLYGGGLSLLGFVSEWWGSGCHLGLRSSRSIRPSNCRLRARSNRTPSSASGTAGSVASTGAPSDGPSIRPEPPALRTGRSPRSDALSLWRRGWAPLAPGYLCPAAAGATSYAQAPGYEAGYIPLVEWLDELPATGVASDDVPLAPRRTPPSARVNLSLTTPRHELRAWQPNLEANEDDPPWGLSTPSCRAGVRVYPPSACSSR